MSEYDLLRTTALFAQGLQLRDTLEIPGATGCPLEMDQRLEIDEQAAHPQQFPRIRRSRQTQHRRPSVRPGASPNRSSVTGSRSRMTHRVGEMHGGDHLLDPLRRRELQVLAQQAPIDMDLVRIDRRARVERNGHQFVTGFHGRKIPRQSTGGHFEEASRRCHSRAAGSHMVR